MSRALRFAVFGGDERGDGDEPVDGDARRDGGGLPYGNARGDGAERLYGNARGAGAEQLYESVWLDAIAVAMRRPNSRPPDLPISL